VPITVRICKYFIILQLDESSQLAEESANKSKEEQEEEPKKEVNFMRKKFT